MKSPKTYHYNIPKILIYIIHILFGIWLMYLGYKLTQKEKLLPYEKIILITLGTIVIVYQLWLWYKFPKDNYSYNVPGWLIHLAHVLVGIYLVLLATKLNSPFVGALTIGLASLPVFYMLHLWILG
tara:strand:+ start:212 stop:589 length:378 start_codon:yes stop_codon:yes gene_type:complete